MKYVMRYTAAPDVADRAPAHFEAHSARLHEFHARGTLLMAGPLADQSGAIGIFTSREAAEEFIAGDPFVRHGVVTAWDVAEWIEVLAPGG